jgi:hypothetical protein
VDDAVPHLHACNQGRLEGKLLRLHFGRSGYSSSWDWLTAEQQMRFHSGYELRERDREDLARLRATFGLKCGRPDHRCRQPRMLDTWVELPERPAHIDPAAPLTLAEPDGRAEVVCRAFVSAGGLPRQPAQS